MSRDARSTSWKKLVYDVVNTLPRTFELKEVLARKDFFSRHYPENRFVDAKIRQSLQVLRDQRVLRFLGNGRYERLEVRPAFSPLIDPNTAMRFTSRTQASRVMLETWAELNLYCVNCAADELRRLTANTPVADFACDSCDDRFQIKSKDGRFTAKIVGAAYLPTIEAIRRGRLPEYVLVEYDPRFATVVFVDAIPGRLITPERVTPRKPLAATARRAGWQGCTIDVSELPRVRLVEPAGLERADVRKRWQAIAKPT